MGTGQTFQEWVGGKAEEATNFVQTNVLNPVSNLSGNTNVLQNPGEALENYLKRGGGFQLMPGYQQLTNLLNPGKSNSPQLDTAPIDALLLDAENKKKDDELKAAETAARLIRQMQAAFVLEKSGSTAYKRGGTLLTSPLGLPDPVSGKPKNSAIGA